MTITCPKRKPLRIPEFDYSEAGAYFVTICSYNKRCIFGHIVDTQMHLNKVGKLVTTFWEQLPRMYSFVSLDHWVVMPNHLHGIIWLKEENPTGKPLWEIIGSYKSMSTSRAKKVFYLDGSLWQRGFYEHIIRDDKDLFRIRQYIEDNPAQWAVDCENPDFNAPVSVGGDCIAP